MPASSRIISEVLPQIHTMEKCIFLRSMIYSQKNKFLILTGTNEPVIKHFCKDEFILH